MKKVLFSFAVASLFAFASCDSPSEERAEDVQEEMEDVAEEREELQEEVQEYKEEVADTTAIVQ